MKLLLIVFLSVVPTKKQVWQKIVESNIKYPEIVWRQAWLESNCGKHSNNLFGFRTKSGYIKYEKWEESVTYYKEWQDKKLKQYKKERGFISYYDFLWWVGYKDGKKYSNAGKKYVDYLKRIKLNYE